MNNKTQNDTYRNCDCKEETTDFLSDKEKVARFASRDIKTVFKIEEESREGKIKTEN